MKDALFINGQIYTFESSPPFVEALAVRDGRIAAIGRSADLRDSCSGFRRVDLGSRDGHLLWVNSAALRLARIDQRTPNPSGGEISRDGRGQPSGLLKE